MCRQPDLVGAVNYAINLLRSNLSRELVYHSLEHTCDEVARSARRIAHLTGVNLEEMLLIRTAAYFHDVGFINRRHEHEQESARIAASVLPQFGYSAAQIDLVTGQIIATRFPQSPQNALEAILADADLSVLGKKQFLARNQDLRQELAALGEPVSDDVWYSSQLAFLRSHRYFTPVARKLYDSGKVQNVRLLTQILMGVQG